MAPWMQRAIRQRRIPEFNCTAYLFRDPMQWVHVQSDSPNNVFMAGFPTPVADSTGVPHILEHTVLCGSRRYPVRDPFFKMLSRSMATFMNAMTGDDVTVYPFSSQNAVDYRNLLHVYLDAVFHPKLEQLDFQ